MFTFKDSLILSLLTCGLFYGVNTKADDGLTPGPGLFSGARGEFSLGTILSSRSRNNRHEKHSAARLDELALIYGSLEAGEPSDSDKPLQTETTIAGQQSKQADPLVSAVDTDSKPDFSAYKEWRALHQKDPSLYESFEVWLEYQSYVNPNHVDQK